MTTNRRDFMVGTGAALALAHLPARAAGDGDAAAEKLLAETAEEIMVDYPETASSLGIDKDKRVALKSKLQDRSAAGQKAIEQRIAKRLERLKAVDTSRLSDGARIDVDVVRTPATSVRSLIGTGRPPSSPRSPGGRASSRSAWSRARSKHNVGSALT